MHRRRLSVVLAALAIALDEAACARAKRPSVQPAATVPGAILWQQPADLSTRDLYYGPWGSRRAPDPKAIYTLVERKHSGVNLGMTVVDPEGREWSVKQPYPSRLDDEGPVEVTLSRVLSGVGYHQPPVYYLPHFTLKDDWGLHTEAGGRFRLKEEGLKDVGLWRWEENPFVGTKPYQGLLVLLTMFNSTDLKNSNNSLYERRNGDRVERWYVVRDIGSALGDTNAIAARKNQADAFERHPFILGVQGGHVEFASHGWYSTLVRDRITADDVAWASNLLSQLSDRQWRDAFRAGGYEPQVADRFIRKLREKIRQGQDVTRRASAR
jgi:hypothetical protein